MAVIRLSLLCLSLFFVFGVSSLFLSSCIKEVDLDLPPHEPRLVINAVANPDSVLRINVRHTVSILDTARGIVEDAQVILYIDNVLYDTLEYMGYNGWYNAYLYPEANKDYRIEVHHPTMPRASVSFKIPDVITIKSATFTLGEILNEELEPASTFTIKLANPQGERNYFVLKFYYGMINSSNKSPLFPAHFFNMADPSILADGNWEYNPRIFYFSDSQFGDGEDIVISVNLRYADYIEFPDGTLQPKNNFYVHVQHITEEYYNYLKSYTVHFFNQNSTQNTRDPLTLVFQGDPVPLYTNVEGGYGIVGACRESVAQLTLKQ